VAFGLLSVMVAIFFNLIPSSVLASNRAENRLSAGNLAQNTLEELKAAPWDTLLSSDGNVETVQQGNVTFTVSTTVSNIPSSNPDHLKVARVQVTWKERAKEQSVGYELRIFNRHR